MRHRTPHFAHIFSGEGYSAGYYGYMWADVLTSDAAEAFAEAPGGFYDKELAEKLVAHLFAVRNAVHPADAYRAFRGRDARIEALMPSAASRTTTISQSSPAKTRARGPSASGKQTRTSQPVASAARTCRRNSGTSSTGSSSLSVPRIREDAPAASTRMQTPISVPGSTRAG